MTDSDDAELLQVFLEETREHLDGIEGDLLRLEGQSTPDLELVNKLFRAVHSVKGGAGFFGFVAIKTLAHALETSLGAIRKQELLPTPSLIGLLLRAADLLNRLVLDPAATADTDVSDLVRELEGSVAESQPEESVVPPSHQGDAPSSGAQDSTRAQSLAPQMVASVDPIAAPPRVAPSPAKAPVASDSSIRVHLGVLDRLMALAGELVLTRNQLLQSVDSSRGSNYSDATQRIDHITTELQDAIMSTRMQSVGIVFQKFRRVVRELANSLGKEVDLLIEGEEVELDRSIIEAIGDPLTHLVRNSLDHGIERPAVRMEHEKPRRGTLKLSAFHKAGQVIIEIADDGAGIDPNRVANKAVEKGLCTKEQVAAMSEAAIIKLIFRPGFSTAAEVTEVSGRGVGMDVVHSNLSRIGGVVDVQSRVGKGTLMRIKLPLTLAIIPCLLVTEEGESFAIPQANLVELHRIAARDVHSRVKKFGDALVLRLRGDLIPLIRLRSALNIPTQTFSIDTDDRKPDQRTTGYDRRAESSPPNGDRRRQSDRRNSHHSAVNIAIVAAGDFRYGIMVESLQDSLEIVVKPLGSHLRRCDSYAGATILGDGSLALILDVVALGRKVQSAEQSEALASAQAATAAAIDTRDQLSLMLVENSGSELLAIPLGLIERIERLQRSDIQLVGGRRTLTYRGRSLPLLAIEEVVHVDPCRDLPHAYAVVFRSHDREIGLIVSDLVDIIESTAELDELTHRQAGVFGSLLVDGKVALLLDVHAIASVCLGTQDSAVATTTGTPATILIVEDSRFFRERLIEFHREAGYRVLVAEDGQVGLDLLTLHAGDVSLVVTDIEMPNLDGLEFTRRVRANPRFHNLPIIAVTSLMGEEAERRGLDAGITEYLIKLDRERILERVRFHLEAKDRHYRKGTAA